MLSVRKIVLILSLVTLVSVGVFLMLDPTFRYPLMGVKLERELSEIQGRDVVAVRLSLETGTELLSEEDLQTEPVVQDDYNVFLLLEESLQNKQESAELVYKVEKMESDQWAWKKAQLNKLQLRSEAYPRKICLTPTLTFPKDSEMATQDVWAPFLSFLWPKYQEGFLKAGRSHWTEQFSFKAKTPLHGKETVVVCKLVYSLGTFQNTGDNVLAQVSVLGTLSAGGDEETVEVQGTIKGHCLVEPEFGRVFGGEYRIEQRIMVRQPGLPVLRKTSYQGAQFWRPMFEKQKAPEQPESEKTPAPLETPIAKG